MALSVNVAQLQRLQGTFPTDDVQWLPQPRQPEQPDGATFVDTLKDAVHSVDGAQKAAEGQIEAFIAGEQENLHEVMISMNQAKLHFQLMTETRNKMLETYQELMRMPV
jgi:flagellar hook-basal body complex protein FliE